jgi:hypothetical protein
MGDLFLLFCASVFGLFGLFGLLRVLSSGFDMFELVAFGFGALYTYVNRNSDDPPLDDPPLDDVFSPLVTLILALNTFVSYPVSMLSSLVILSLVIDSVADYLMDSHKLKLPIFLFSCGHLVRQIIVSNIAPGIVFRNTLSDPWFKQIILPNIEPSVLPGYSQSELWFRLTQVISQIIVFLMAWDICCNQFLSQRLSISSVPIFIGGYAIVIVITFLQIWAGTNAFSIGFLLFIISDLIIATELIFGKIYPRQLRVLLVPILYWTAEFLIIKDLLRYMS